MDKPSRGACSECGAWWRLPFLLVLVLTAMLLFRVRGGRETATEPARGHRQASDLGDSGSVAFLAVDLGDGRSPQYEPTAWRAGLTVHEAMLQMPAEQLSLETLGSGASAFLTALNGKSNEGPGGKNWTYRVNGELAEQGFAVYELQPGDRVLWTFAVQE